MLDPPHNLLAHLLVQAIRDALQPGPVTLDGAKPAHTAVSEALSLQRGHQDGAIAWLLDPDWEAPICCEFACEALGISASGLRSAVCNEITSPSSKDDSMPDILTYLQQIAESHIATAREKPSPLLSRIRARPGEIDILSPDEFEALIQELFQRMGGRVFATGRTTAKDGGIDLIVKPSRTFASMLIAVQVKQHQPGLKSGREDVDRLLAWRGTPFHLGYLVTNTAFTRDAIWAAAQPAATHFIRLRSRNNVLSWLRDDFKGEGTFRELPTSIPLAPGITIDLAE